ncbi:MAG: inositol monophosphatase [Bacteroidales bacterium]|nr:inositol monophosphatase [Bacteroidales bacterium]MBN2763128.1 inositol monophosphatase [Bacteroidales bacterium]
MDFRELCESVISVAKDTGDFIRGQLNQISVSHIQVKGRQNFVTEVDKGAEERIVKRLEKLLPEAGFITEEGTSTKKGVRYTWVIDPLDGTTNFIHGAPFVAVSIALLEDKEPVIGVIYEIFMDECFYAWKGSKAYLNGREINVSATAEVKDALIATGFPYENFNRIDSFMQSLRYFFTNSHGVRRLGSAATDLAYVACGRYDAFYEYNLNTWDIAAGVLILKQAGGKASDFKGGSDFLFNREIVASNSNMYSDFLSQVGRFMNVR